MCEFCSKLPSKPLYLTRPARPLTYETSRGFEAIDFIEEVFGLNLYTWQKVATVHMLETNEDGSYRFRSSFITVARQNGKTTLMTGISAWWLYLDSYRDISTYGRSRYRDGLFQILGVANAESTAKEPWSFIRTKSDKLSEDRVENFVEMVRRIREYSVETSITTTHNSKYLVKAYKTAVGKSAARLLADEIREYHRDDVWANITPTTLAIPNSQIVAFSTAGTGKSVVWQNVRDSAIKDVKDKRSTRFIIEWSAPEACDLNDDKYILAANPSIGEAPLTIALCRSKIEELSESNYRNHILNSPITAKADPYLSLTHWDNCVKEDSAVDDRDRVMLAIDVDFNRSWASIAIAGKSTKAIKKKHIETITTRKGFNWVVKALQTLHDKYGYVEVCLSSKGPVSELVDKIKAIGFTVYDLSFAELALATTYMKAEVDNEHFFHLGDSQTRHIVANATTRAYGDSFMWSRSGTAVDVTPVVALSMALWAVTHKKEEIEQSAYEDKGVLFLT